MRGDGSAVTGFAPGRSRSFAWSETGGRVAEGATRLSPTVNGAIQVIGETGMKRFEASHDRRTTAKPRTIDPPAMARREGLV